MHVIIATLLLLLASAAPARAQAPPAAEPAKPPQKGDEVLVRGCVTGTMLQASSTRRPAADSSIDDAITYRLSGPRGILRTIRADHDGQIVEVRGVLRSKLPEARGGQPGTRELGKTGIFVGLGAPPRGNSPGDMVPYIPVLEVVSFETVGSRCTR
jgi:hypothetical protein